MTWQRLSQIKKQKNKKNSPSIIKQRYLLYHSHSFHSTRLFIYIPLYAVSDGYHNAKKCIIDVQVFFLSSQSLSRKMLSGVGSQFFLLESAACMCW